jgi:hypothetical protein
MEYKRFVPRELRDADQHQCVKRKGLLVLAGWEMGSQATPSGRTFHVKDSSSLQLDEAIRKNDTVKPRYAHRRIRKNWSSNVEKMVS